MQKVLNINDITLALDNPRLSDSISEEEEIEKMILEQKSKLIELANDIVTFGLSPLDNIAVYPSNIIKGKYVVSEGNRRICVLKLLNDPELVSSIDNNTYIKFKELSTNFKLENVSVEVFKNEEDVQHWIELRHLGEQKGKGLSKWDSIQKSRYEKKKQGNNKLLDFWSFLNENNILTYDEIFQITKTNWQRILRDDYYDFLKIYEDNDKLLVKPEDISIFTERIRAVHKNLAGKTVAIVYDGPKIKEFFEGISEELYGENIIDRQFDFQSIEQADLNCDFQLSVEDTNSSVAEDNNSSSIGILQEENNDEELSNNFLIENSNGNNNTDYNSLGINSNNNDLESNGGKNNLPYFFTGLKFGQLSATDPLTHGVTCICNELRLFSERRLVNTYPISAAFLTRAIIEQSIIYYSKKTNIQGQTKKIWDKIVQDGKDDKLSNIIKNYSKNLSNYINDDIIRKYFKNLFDDYDKTASPLNWVVHKPDEFRVIPDNLIRLPAQGLLALVNYLIK